MEYTVNLSSHSLIAKVQEMASKQQTHFRDRQSQTHTVRESVHSVQCQCRRRIRREHHAASGSVPTQCQSCHSLTTHQRVGWPLDGPVRSERTLWNARHRGGYPSARCGAQRVWIRELVSSTTTWPPQRVHVESPSIWPYDTTPQQRRDGRSKRKCSGRGLEAIPNGIADPLRHQHPAPRQESDYGADQRVRCHGEGIGAHSAAIGVGAQRLGTAAAAANEDVAA